MWDGKGCRELALMGCGGGGDEPSEEQRWCLGIALDGSIEEPAKDSLIL